MANHKSALKRIRQNEKRRARNRSARSEIRTTIKSALAAAEQGNKDEAQTIVKKASSLLSKSIVHGVHHKKNATRRISRLTQRVSSILSAAS